MTPQGRRLHAWIAAALAIGAGAPGAAGQSVLFISPDSAETPVGGAVVVSAQRAEGAGAVVPAAWPADRIAWMFVRCGGGQTNFEPGTPAAAPGRAGPSVAVDGLDAALIGVDLTPRDEELDAKALVGWAKTNLGPKAMPAGLDALEAKGGKVTVRRVESAKTFARGRGPGEQRRGDRPVRSATATDKSGQAVEIRPLLDVTSAVTPTDIPVRVYAFGDGAKGALLRVVHVESGAEQRLVTDDKAIAWVRLDRTGLYRMELHAAAAFTPVEGEGSNATWSLHSATATFTVPPAGGARAPGASAPDKETSR